MNVPDDLLHRLAGYGPWAYYSEVDADLVCFYCGGKQLWGKRLWLSPPSWGYLSTTHADDCPWVEARKLLGLPVEV